MMSEIGLEIFTLVGSVELLETAISLPAAECVGGEGNSSLAMIAVDENYYTRD